MHWVIEQLQLSIEIYLPLIPELNVITKTDIL